jgi:hypothetical protein
MNILVLHRVPFDFLKYDVVIDHTVHQVMYAGREKELATIPPGLACLHIPLSEEGDLVGEVLNHLKRYDLRIDRIVAMSSYQFAQAAKLRTILDIEGEKEDGFELTNNKLAMKKAVLAAGLRAPRNVACLEALHGTQPSPLMWSGKTVLKPVDGAASRDVHVFATYEKARNAVLSAEIAAAAVEPARFEFEEFVEGRIHHVDGYRINGKTFVSIESRYVGTCLEYAHGRPLGSVQCDLGSDRAAIFDPYLDAVQLRTGSFHLEMIDSPEGMCFLEVGARVGGADVGTVMQMSTGLDMDHLTMALMLDSRDLEHNEFRKLLTPQARKAVYGWFVFPGHLLRLSSSIAIEDAANVQHSKSVLFWREVSDAGSLSREISYNAHEVPLSGVVCDESAALAEHLIEEILARTRVTEAI